jgi:hypothetical protein
VFLLCSDGLTGMVEDERILEEVERHRTDLKRAAKELVSAANKGGGEDNITVVFFEIADPDAELEETATMPVAESADDGAGEETLDELDRVPAVDTMVVPPEEAGKFAEAAEESERPSRRKRLVVLLLLLLVLLAAAAVVLWMLR